MLQVPFNLLSKNPKKTLRTCLKSSFQDESLSADDLSSAKWVAALLAVGGQTVNSI